jgi:hypothetical protein
MEMIRALVTVPDVCKVTAEKKQTALSWKS